MERKPSHVKMATADGGSCAPLAATFHNLVTLFLCFFFLDYTICSGVLYFFVNCFLAASLAIRKEIWQP